MKRILDVIEVHIEFPSEIWFVGTGGIHTE